jgi:hypothetical protein
MSCRVFEEVSMYDTLQQLWQLIIDDCHDRKRHELRQKSEVVQQCSGGTWLLPEVSKSMLQQLTQWERGLGTGRSGSGTYLSAPGAEE